MYIITVDVSFLILFFIANTTKATLYKHIKEIQELNGVFFLISI